MDPQIIRLYDEYTHKPLSRREFINRLACLAGSTAAAYLLLPLLENNYALAAQVPEQDPRLQAVRISYPGAKGALSGYLAKPLGHGAPLPALILIHENRGLNPHIQDVARRLALAGFLTLAPDLLSPLGGTPTDEDQAREMIGTLVSTDVVADLLATQAFLQQHADSTGRVGAIGFCWGGGMSNQLASRSPQLQAAVVYYGPSPGIEQVAAIRAPLLLHYAGLDERINKGVPAFEASLKSQGKHYQLFRYPNVNHAFNNDTNPARYNQAAAHLAWQRTLTFLQQHLTG